MEHWIIANNRSEIGVFMRVFYLHNCPHNAAIFSFYSIYHITDAGSCGQELPFFRGKRYSTNKRVCTNAVT